MSIRLTDEEVQHRLRSRRIEMLTPYVNSHTYGKFRCLKCNHEWKTQPTHIFTHDTGCPLCGQFKNEMYVGQWLKTHVTKPRKVIHHLRLFKNLNPSMPCKYIIPDYAITDRYGSIMLLVEMNGIQHYQSIERWGGDERFHQQRKRDAWLRRFCKRRGITLLAIDGRKISGRKRVDEFLSGHDFLKGFCHADVRLSLQGM